MNKETTTLHTKFCTYFGVPNSIEAWEALTAYAQLYAKGETNYFPPEMAYFIAEIGRDVLQGKTPDSIDTHTKPGRKVDIADYAIAAVRYVRAVRMGIITDKKTPPNCYESLRYRADNL